MEMTTRSEETHLNSMTDPKKVTSDFLSEIINDIPFRYL